MEDKMKKTKNTYIEVILKNLQENKKIYILLLIFLFIGIVLGVFFINFKIFSKKF